jgi:hypothetical protein
LENPQFTENPSFETFSETIARLLFPLQEKRLISFIQSIIDKDTPEEVSNLFAALKANDIIPNKSVSEYYYPYIYKLSKSENPPVRTDAFLTDINSRFNVLTKYINALESYRQYVEKAGNEEKEESIIEIVPHPETYVNGSEFTDKITTNQKSFKEVWSRSIEDPAFQKTKALIKEFIDELSKVMALSWKDLIGPRTNPELFKTLMEQIVIIAEENNVLLADLVVGMSAEKTGEYDEFMGVYDFICWRFMVEDPKAFEKFLKN